MLARAEAQLCRDVTLLGELRGLERFVAALEIGATAERDQTQTALEPDE